MARKQKKLSRKQLAQQRREAITQTREAKRWTPPQAPAGQPPADILDDMLPLFPLLEERLTSPAAQMEPLMLALMDSADLMEEPEFEKIIIDPIQCVDTFVAVGEELGIDPNLLAELPDEEREDKQMDMLEMTTHRLLTDELRQEIIDGLNKLRLRLKLSRQREKVARVAAVQLVLSEPNSSQMWPMIGLVQALVRRSLAAGFELMATSVEALEAGRVSDSDTPLTLSQKLAQSNLNQKTTELLKKVPGLRGFLEDQAEKIWEEGEKAIFTGELYLELFTPEEIGAGLEMFEVALRADLPEEMSPDEISALQLTREKMSTLIQQSDDYLTELFTPERLNQLHTRIRAILNDRSYPPKWSAFLLMLDEYMGDEAAVENEKSFLIKAFLGELRAASQIVSETQA